MYDLTISQQLFISSGSFDLVNTFENTSPYTIVWSRIGTGHWKCQLSGYSNDYPPIILIGCDQDNYCFKATYGTENYPDWIDVYTYNSSNVLSDSANFSIVFKFPKS